MQSNIVGQLKIAVIVLVSVTILTGIIYPLVVTMIGQLCFPLQANGSLITYDNKLIGSQLLGQNFTSNRYFWGRPSATIPFPYNSASSAGSNLGPSNPVLIQQIKKRSEYLLQSIQEDIPAAMPIELLMASGSGLDPDISPLGAYFQASRIAKERNISLNQIYALIETHTISRSLGILGEPRVNVLAINLALNNLKNDPTATTLPIKERQ